MHSKLPPSSAARRLACPGSRALEELYPETEKSPSAEEGTLAHTVAAELLRGNPVPKSAATQEMIDGACSYAQYILDTVGDKSRELHIEEKVDISVVHPDCWGTPDCWDIRDNVLHVFDYKFGHGYVEVYENWQLIEYAMGILHSVKLPITSVCLHIIQPRGYHPMGSIRKWEFSSKFFQYYLDTLKQSEALAMSDNAGCIPNPQCNYCKGRAACVALKNASLTAVDVSSSNTPFNLNSDAIGNELRYLKRASKLLEARISGLEEQATSMIKKGERVPYHRLEQSKGREQWAKDVKEVIELGEMLGISLAKPKELITPRQAIKAGIPEDIVHSYSIRLDNALKLVEEESKAIRKIFGATI